MQLQLANKIAFISGSTKGIGFAIARQLAAEGARVILNGRSDQALADATAKLRSAVPNAQVEGLVGDLSDAKTSDALAQQFPAVDVLVNNLGIFEPKPFEATPDEDWRRFFEVNVLSGVR
jgi:NAD(P)-dependent dehydrogenase (short-subunit alcohol dehydrogenase family)